MRKKRVHNNTQEWRCLIKTCKPRGKSDLNYSVNLNSFYILGEHNHDPDIMIINKKKHLTKIKNGINNNNMFNPRMIVNEALRVVNTEIVRSLGNFSFLYRNLRNYRSNIINPKPYYYPTLKISEVLS